MLYFFGWLVAALIIGALGDTRKIGFWGAFFVSLILSPLIGLIVILVSENKPSQVVQPAPQGNAPSTIEQLERLAKLRADGALSAEEFEAEKSKILHREQAAQEPKRGEAGTWDDHKDVPMR